jgi:hypothetical protein
MFQSMMALMAKHNAGSPVANHPSPSTHHSLTTLDSGHNSTKNNAENLKRKQRNGEAVPHHIPKASTTTTTQVQNLSTGMEVDLLSC